MKALSLTRRESRSSPLSIGGEKIYWRLLYANPLYGLTLKGRVPDSLRLAPPMLRRGDPEAGRAILRGRFSLRRRSIELGPEPWKSPIEDTRRLAALHGFSWLADLFALGGDEARNRAGALLRDWIGLYGKWHAFSWRADILGERLHSWLAFHAFLAAQDDRTGALLLEHAAIQARHLARCCVRAPEDIRYFHAVQGLIYASVCLPGREASLDLSLGLLEKGLSRQVLPDGGHVERNPSSQLELLSRLNQIRALLVAARIEPPPGLQGGIDRMSPMLRGLRHGDGGLALFNGGVEEERSYIDTVLADTGVRGRPLASAPHSGFQRLSAGRTVVIVDCGRPPQTGAGAGHAGTLGFEMSVGKDRLVVNCGAPGAEGDRWAAALRATAAHSTVTVDDANSSEFGADGVFLHRPDAVDCTRREDEGSQWLETSHDGYRESIGVVHRRQLYLSSSGEDFRGEDDIEGSGGTHFAVRFHLHPNVHASLGQGGASVLLKPAHGGGWRFLASGGRLRIEESVYLNGQGEPRRSDQIVITGPLHGDGAQIKWRFHRV